jgi:hypothetical protein
VTGSSLNVVVDIFVHVKAPYVSKVERPRFLAVGHEVRFRVFPDFPKGWPF